MKLVEPDTVTIELTNQERKELIEELQDLSDSCDGDLSSSLEKLWCTLVNGTSNKGKKR